MGVSRISPGFFAEKLRAITDMLIGTHSENCDMSASISTVFRECHRLRRHLRDLKDEIDRGPRILKARQTHLANEEQAHKLAYDTIKKLKLKQKDDEGSLKTIEQQLSRLATRAMEVTTMKEMLATKSEIDQATAKKNILEDTILETITDVEDRTADLPNVEKRWADAQAEFKEYQLEAKERLERMIADQQRCESELLKQDAMIPPEVLGQYTRLVKGYGPDGLAGLKGLICQQCRSKVTEGQRTDLEGGAFVCCSSCGRALYTGGD